MTATIDLNADLGESVDGVPTADDEAMFEVITSASIACGGHAGDDSSMRESVQRALRHRVAIGAHPSYVDAENFGRVEMQIEPSVLRAQLREQLERLLSQGATVRYVKPHGALYHRVMVDRAVADALAGAVCDVFERGAQRPALLGMRGEIEEAARSRGLDFHYEAFLDRAYLADGTLVPRIEPASVLHDADVVAARAVRLATEGIVEAVDGTLIRPGAVSFCIHGDSPGAVAMARAVRGALDEAGVKVLAPW